MRKALVIGGAGNIGRRYVAILRHLGFEYDIADPKLAGTMNVLRAKKLPYGRIIVATPTDTHGAYLEILKDHDIPILCEKPLSLSLAQCSLLEKIMAGKEMFVVNNYAYALFDADRPFDLTYNYYNTGPHGLLWDCCQLLVLDPKAKLLNTSPVWQFKNGSRVISYRQIEGSYISMIRDFMEGRFKSLWSLDKGVIMATRVEERNAKDIDRGASTDILPEIAGKGVRTNRRQIHA